MKWLAATLVVLATACPRPEERCELNGTTRTSGSGRTVVWLAGPPNPPAQTAELTVHRREMTPFVVVLQRGDTLKFSNRDELAHRIHGRGFADTFQLDAAGQGALGERTFETPGHVRIGCDAHPWERADVLVLETRQFTIANADGTWMLPRVRTGAHTVFAWQPDGSTVSKQITACTEVPELTPTPGRSPGP